LPAGAACLLVRGLAGRDAIYQLIPWVRRWDVGEPSLTRSLAAPRAAHPYPPDRVLNAAGNRGIGLNAGRANFQMRTAVAVWQHARIGLGVVLGGETPTRQGGQLGSNQKTWIAVSRA
jgi:hypothetical protein